MKASPRVSPVLQRYPIFLLIDFEPRSALLTCLSGLATTSDLFPFPCWVCVRVSWDCCNILRHISLALVFFGSSLVLLPFSAVSSSAVVEYYS